MSKKMSSFDYLASSISAITIAAPLSRLKLSLQVSTVLSDSPISFSLKSKSII